jgi:magnesium chelatase family protein
MSKISGPLLDRIDIHCEVAAVKYQELASKRNGETSSCVRERVVRARRRQAERYAGRDDVYKNSDMGSRDIREHCALDTTCQEILKMAMSKLGLSARAYDKILKVSRTIADLAECDQIRPEHLSEAIQYRSLDRQFWNV